MQSPLHLISHTHYCCGGDVTIDPTAAIAAGVVLQAEAGSQIVIGANACLGAGVVFQARGGVLRVEDSVSLGASALVVGQGKIGAGACIGPASTLIDPAIGPGEVVAAGSLVAVGQVSTVPSQPSSARVNGFAQASNGANNGTSNGFVAKSRPETNGAAVAQTNGQSKQVYGRDQVNQLLSNLFPHRQPLN